MPATDINQKSLNWKHIEWTSRVIDETWPEWKLDSWGKQQRKLYEARRGEAGDVPLHYIGNGGYA
jgi:hypothetical protein